MSFFGGKSQQEEQQQQQSVEYQRGLQEGSSHTRSTKPSWVKATVTPAIVFGIPFLISMAYMWIPLTMSPSAVFRERAGQALRRAMGKKTKKAAGAAGNPFQQMMEQMMPIQKRQFRVDVKGTKFADVIGIPEALAEVRQYVDFLRNPATFTRLGARLPRGCILTGEPGTGKTLLAKAVAGEAGVPFFSCSGSDFIEIMGGSGPKRVRELFAEAREAAPCIVFIDEIDAIGTRGGNKAGGGGGTSSEENRTINQLLAELDGLSTSDDAVIVMAATNLLDNIDKALLREGRFDRKVPVDMPDLNARRDLFLHYLNRVITGDPRGVQAEELQAKLAKEKVEAEAAKAKAQAGEPSDAGEDVPKAAAAAAVPSEAAAPKVVRELKPGDVDNNAMALRLADLTPGISPATVATIVNEGALQSALVGKQAVDMADLMAAVDNTLVGKKHRQRMAADALRRTALHETGHALVAWLLPQQKAVLKISVVPRGQALGYTQKAGSEYHEYQTNVTMLTDLMVLMGGRAAEDVLLGVPSLGAQDDVQRATQLAMQKLLAFGMSPQVGMLAFHPEETRRGRSFVHFSEATQATAEKEAKRIVEFAYTTARGMVETHRAQVEAMTDLLVERKEVLQEDVERLWGPRPAAPTSLDLTKKLEEIFGTPEGPTAKAVF